MKLPIYMDYQATTPVDPEVFRAMEPYFCRDFGNAASKSHAFGWQAEAAVEMAREQVAACLGASEKEIYFTSGATESNNLAILGIAQAYQNKGNHIITGATEHRAVLDPCRFLQKKGFQLTILPVDRHGLIDPQRLAEAITPKTILITFMSANN
jgi:cysteine desulfurase